MNNKQLWIWAFVFLACMADRSPVLAQNTWDKLLGVVPADANTLVLVNLERLRASPFATKFWSDPASVPAAGLRSLLPRGEVDRAAFTARLNLVDLRPEWESGVFQTESDPSLALFAGGIRGPQESIGTTAAIRLPFDAYLLKLAPKTFGMLGPADRQKTARWLRQSATAKPLDSEYLQKITGLPETESNEVLVAVDLNDAIDMAQATKVLTQSTALREQRISPAAAAEIFTSLEGMSLSVRVTDQAAGKIRIDFKRDAAVLAPAMKALLLERLAARGAMIPEFADWKIEVNGNTALLSGILTPIGLSRVLSIVEPELPASQPDASTIADTLKPTDSGSALLKQRTQPSRQHFIKVRNLVTEVRFPSSELKIYSASSFGVWIERQARRIDQLPMLDVDPELPDYSQGVAQSLRVSAAKLRGASIRASVYSNNQHRYNDSGYAVQGGAYEGNTYASPKTIQSRMETAAANLVHVDIMRMIDDETAAIRRTMTERYQVEF